MIATPGARLALPVCSLLFLGLALPRAYTGIDFTTQPRPSFNTLEYLGATYLHVGTVALPSLFFLL